MISKNTTPFTLKQEVAHQNKISAVLEKITKLKEKAAASEEKLSKAAKTAGGSGAHCTWTDKKTSQLIAARSVNDHFFDQHNNNDQNKWAIVTESYKVGRMAPKSIIENGTQSILYPALTEEDFKTAAQLSGESSLLNSKQSI